MKNIFLKELTEEGLPFLILFHRAEDEGSVKIFEKEVKNQLAHVKSNKNLSSVIFF